MSGPQILGLALMYQVHPGALKPSRIKQDLLGLFGGSHPLSSAKTVTDDGDGRPSA